MKVHKYNTKKYNFGELLEGKYTDIKLFGLKNLLRYGSRLF